MQACIGFIWCRSNFVSQRLQREKTIQLKSKVLDPSDNSGAFVVLSLRHCVVHLRVFMLFFFK